MDSQQNLQHPGLALPIIFRLPDQAILTFKHYYILTKSAKEVPSPSSHLSKGIQEARKFTFAAACHE
jgi:hypothetical protein